MLTFHLQGETDVAKTVQKKNHVQEGAEIITEPDQLNQLHVQLILFRRALQNSPRDPRLHWG